jgi:hypothetical protein
VGGMRPYPGMIVEVEKIQLDRETIYQKSKIEPCRGDLPCQDPQNPTGDIQPPDFSFYFVPETKTILETTGSESGPFFDEIYSIEFFLNEESHWMICHRHSILAP